MYLMSLYDLLKETSDIRSRTLQQSLQLQRFLQDLYHEHEWISLKSQVANDQNYKYNLFIFSF